MQQSFIDSFLSSRQVNQLGHALKPSHIQKRGENKPGFIDIMTRRIYRGLNACSAPTKFSWNPRAKNNGVLGGLRVHEQVEYVIKAMSSLETLVPLKRPKQFTLQVFAALCAHSLVPVESEYCILNKEKNICTAIDIICLNSANEYCIVSLKTGYDPDRVPRKSADEHRSQLMFEVETFENFTEHTAAHAYILYTYRDFGKKKAMKKQERMNSNDVLGRLLYCLRCSNLNDLMFYLKGAQLKKIK